MRRRLLAILLVFGVAGGLLFAGIVATGSAAAQSDPANSSSVYADVDEDIRITSWEYSEETESFEITLDNDGTSRTRVSLMEIIDLDGDREGPLGMREVSLRPGEETSVEIGAQLDSGSAGIIVMTQQSLDNGQVQPVIYDEGTSLSILSGASTWGYVQIGAISGGIGTLLIGVLVAWDRRASRNDSSEVKL